MQIFSFKNVSFKNIINYPNIEIQAGNMTFIVGESGCGKSTLLKLMNNTQSADSGEILYNGKPIDSYDPIELRREVLLCGQSAYLFDGSIKENFEQYYKYRDLPFISDNDIAAYLNICSAGFPIDTQCMNMSGGEKQRVFIAICISLQPKILLMDEPTSALDDKTTNILMSNIKAFCREKNISTVVISHNKSMTESFADYTITLKATGGGKNE